MTEQTIRSKVRYFWLVQCATTEYDIGVLQHFQENPCCKHIVLGSCHDNGYVCHLDVIRSERSMCDRVTLLKSFQTGREYGDLPFNSVHLPSLFRTHPLSTSTAKNHLKNGIATTSPGLSYAARVKLSNDNIIKGTTPSAANKIFPSVILVNAKGERLDTFLPKPSKATFTNFHRKKRELEANGKRGPCNLHFLCGLCPLSPSECQFWHGGFDKADISALKWFMRFQRCDKGLRCRSASCYYGHVCFACKPGCKFSSDMHQVDRTGEREIPGE